MGRLETRETDATMDESDLVLLATRCPPVLYTRARKWVGAFFYYVTSGFNLEALD